MTDAPSCLRCGHSEGRHRPHPYSTALEPRQPCEVAGCHCFGYVADTTQLPCGRAGCGHPMADHIVSTTEPGPHPGAFTATEPGKGACTYAAAGCVCTTWIADLGARKDDQDKARMELLEAEFLTMMGALAAFGAKKYAVDGWRHLDADRIWAALMRHALDWKTGELHDEETQLPHMVAVALNAMFVWWLSERKP